MCLIGQWYSFPAPFVASNTDSPRAVSWSRQTFQGFPSLALRSSGTPFAAWIVLCASFGAARGWLRDRWSVGHGSVTLLLLRFAAEQHFSLAAPCNWLLLVSPAGGARESPVLGRARVSSECWTPIRVWLYSTLCPFGCARGRVSPQVLRHRALRRSNEVLSRDKTRIPVRSFCANLVLVRCG